MTKSGKWVPNSWGFHSYLPLFYYHSCAFLLHTEKKIVYFLQTFLYFAIPVHLSFAPSACCLSIQAVREAYGKEKKRFRMLFHNANNNIWNLFLLSYWSSNTFYMKALFTLLLGNCNMQFLQLCRIHLCRRITHRTFCICIFREGDHITDGLTLGKNHRDTI